MAHCKTSKPESRTYVIKPAAEMTVDGNLGAPVRPESDCFLRETNLSLPVFGGFFFCRRGNRRKDRSGNPPYLGKEVIITGGELECEVGRTYVGRLWYAHNHGKRESLASEGREQATCAGTPGHRRWLAACLLGMSLCYDILPRRSWVPACRMQFFHQREHFCSCH